MATVNGKFNSDVCHDLQVGARWTRSQCEGLIKQKDEEIKSLKMEMVGLFKLDHVNELLGDASKRAYIAAGGTEKEWKDWHNKANKLKVN